MVRVFCIWAHPGDNALYLRTYIQKQMHDSGATNEGKNAEGSNAAHGEEASGFTHTIGLTGETGLFPCYFTLNSYSSQHLY